VTRRLVAAFLLAAGATLAAATLAPAAHADEIAPADKALADKAAATLAAGEYGAAIDALEALADRGVQHPDASYNRGLAYLMRIRARAGKPGDLGRAAAAFEETRRLRPDDEDASNALDLVRAEVTRRRARKGNDAVDQRPTLDRLVAGLVSDRAWTIASVVASCLLALGLVLRRFDRPDASEPAAAKDAKDLRSTEPAAAHKLASGPAHPLRVAGSVLVIVGVVALLLLAPIAWHARTLRLTTRPGVIITTEAHLTDDTGTAAGGDPIPEAAAVEVGERKAGLVHVRWGAIEGWLPATSVRVLP
jgi:hypothetical protein